VRIGAHQRKRLKRLCRYITRPAIANQRLSRNGKGQVLLQLKSPWRDSTTRIVMSPLEFMHRLAAACSDRARQTQCARRRVHAATCEHELGAFTETRVFDIDIEHWPNCGGALKMIATIEDPAVIVRILSHLGLRARVPQKGQ
jgi:hypothetical protein